MQNDIDRLLARLDEIDGNKKILETLKKNMDPAAGFTIDLWTGPKIDEDDGGVPLPSYLSMSFSTRMEEIVDNLLRALEDDRVLNRSFLERQMSEFRKSINKAEARLGQIASGLL